MQQKKNYIRLWFIALIIVCLNPLAVHANTLQQTTQVAISLVIDQSGSMEEFDPANMRQSAAEMLIDLMSPNDSIGVVRFSNDAREVFPLQTTSDAAKKNELKALLREPAENIGATDYLKALQLAVQQLEQAPEDSQKVVLFLTDGYPEQSAVDGNLPIPEDDYLNLIRDQIQDMGGNGIPIYSIGFGASAEELLEEMALATKGEAAILNSPAQIANTFFDILATTKNRNPLADLNGITLKEQELVIPIGSNTEQVTVLITTDGQQLTVEPRGALPADALLQHYSGYSVLTVNRTSQGTGGDVRLFVQTDGTATVSGVRDSFFKMTLYQPVNNSVKSMGQPITVEVGLSGALDKGMELSAQVLKDGVVYEGNLELMEQGKKYVGRYDQLNELGTYEVIVYLMNGDEWISETSSTFTVKDIPALTSDMDLNEQVFKLGDELAVTGYLLYGNVPDLANNDLKISNYQLIFQKDRNKLTRIPMTADTSTGLYNTNVKFDETGEFDAFLQATGTFQEQSFIQEFPLGRIKVGAVGMMEVILLQNEAIKNGRGTFQVPVRLTNNSAHDEMIQVSVPAEVGSITHANWRIPAGATVEKTITVDLKHKNLETAELFFKPKDARMLVVEGPTRSVALAFEDTLLRSFMPFGQILLAVAALVLLFWLVGQVLYQRLVRRHSGIGSKFWYLDPNGAKDDWKVVRPTIAETSIRIAFGEAEGKFDLLLPAIPEYEPGFLITIDKRLSSEERYHFLEGYKALFGRKPFVIQVSVSPPGYLNYRDRTLNFLTLTEEDGFEVGGHHFFCQMEQTEKEKQMA